MEKIIKTVKAMTQLIALLVALLGLYKTILDFLKKLGEMFNTPMSPIFPEISYPEFKFGNVTVQEFHISIAVLIYLLIIIFWLGSGISLRKRFITYSFLPSFMLFIWAMTFLSQTVWVIAFLFISVLWTSIILVPIPLIYYSDVLKVKDGQIFTRLYFLTMFLFPINALIFMGFGNVSPSWAWIIAILILIKQIFLFFLPAIIQR